MLAWNDGEYMNNASELMPIRMQIELQYIKSKFKEAGIDWKIAIFGSARIKHPDNAKTEAEVKMSKFYMDAWMVGDLVSNFIDAYNCRGVVCTGGGPGIMESVNHAATFHGNLNAGIAVQLPFEAGMNSSVSEGLGFTCRYFATRKIAMVANTLAFVAMPGGFGTLDEVMEVITLMQTGKMEKRLLILYGSEFWKKVINFEYLIECGMISSSDMDLIKFVDDPFDCANLITNCIEKTWS